MNGVQTDDGTARQITSGGEVGRGAKGETGSRRSVRRRRIVVRRPAPLGSGRDELEWCRGWNGCRDKLIRCLIQRNTIQPDNVFIVVSQMGVVLVVPGN